MLVLSRKSGEAIAIEGGIRVKVLSVQGKTVKIGIEAPDSVSISRMELVVDAELSPTDAQEAASIDHRGRDARRKRLADARRSSGAGSMRTAMIPR